jgi:hypothetical protein
MGKMRNVYIILVVKPEGRSSLGRSKRKRVGNVEMDHK